MLEKRNIEKIYSNHLSFFSGGKIRLRGYMTCLRTFKSFMYKLNTSDQGNIRICTKTLQIQTYLRPEQINYLSFMCGGFFTVMTESSLEISNTETVKLLRGIW